MVARKPKASRKKSQAIHVALTAVMTLSAVASPTLSAHASPAACQAIFSGQARSEFDASLFHDLSMFDLKDGTREKILAMKKELDRLRFENREFVLPRHYNAEVNLILFQEMLIGGDFEKERQRFSTLFEEVEGSYLLMRLKDAIADKLESVVAQAPQEKQVQYRQVIAKHRAAARQAKLSFMDHRSEYFPLRMDLDATLNSNTVQDTAQIMNLVELEEQEHDGQIVASQTAVIAGQKLPATADVAATGYEVLVAAAQQPVANGQEAAMQTLTPIIVTPMPAPQYADIPVAAPNLTLAMASAKSLDLALGGYMKNAYFKEQIAEARRILGPDFRITRPTLAELQAFDRVESNTTEAIIADLQTQIEEQKVLKRALWMKSTRAFDKVGLAVNRLPNALRPTAQALLVYSRDNAVRRTYYRDILSVMRQSSDGLDASRRMELLFNLATKYPDDGLLVAYVRVVRSMESWHQMKQFVDSRAFMSPGATQSIKDANYARRFNRLIAAEKQAEIDGDLSLTEEVAPAYLKGLVVWSGIPAAATLLMSSHGHVIESVKSWALSVLPALVN